MDNVSITSFNNGLCHIHSTDGGPNLGYAAVVIRTGSRDEPEDLHGLAHFMEHCLFKGTERRTSRQIINRLETVGADLDAYTTKEFTCYYAVFMMEYMERALELLSDITFKATFPEKEIEKEKNVILDEIQSYLDTPAEQIFDDFESMLFEGHALGKNILGDMESLRRTTTADLQKFRDDHYRPDNMVLSTSGQIKPDKMNRLAQKYFGSQKSSTGPERSQSNIIPKPERQVIRKNTYQTHYITGTKSYHVNNENRLPMLVLNNVIGGQGMNNMLNLNIREKYGYTYHIESGYTPYTDNGIFFIYLGSDKSNIGKIEKLIARELKSLKNKKLSPPQLKKAIQQFKGQLCISYDSSVGKILHRGKTYLTYESVDSLKETLKKIDGITAEKLCEVANETFDLDNFSTLIFENT